MGSNRSVFIVGCIFPLLHRIGNVYILHDETVGTGYRKIIDGLVLSIEKKKEAVSNETASFLFFFSTNIFYSFAGTILKGNFSSAFKCKVCVGKAKLSPAAL